MLDYVKDYAVLFGGYPNKKQRSNLCKSSKLLGVNFFETSFAKLDFKALSAFSRFLQKNGLNFRNKLDFSLSYDILELDSFIHGAGGAPAAVRNPNNKEVSMATLNDIAARLGISKSTVSKGLSNASDVSEDLRKKIMEVAAEMGYSGRRTQKRLCVLVENMGYTEPNQFGYELIAGFTQMASAEGWVVDAVPYTKERQAHETYRDFMAQGGYQGAFLLGFSLVDPWMQGEFQTVQIPTVLYDNRIPENPFMASIGCDCRGGMEAAVRHLYGQGHRRIGLLFSALDSYIVKERYNAFFSAMEKCGLEVDQDLIGLGYYVAETTRKYLPKFVERGATAILCSDDSRALAAYTECCDRRLRVPEDVSIIGFDDLPISAYMNPPLTTIRQNRLALGKCGYYALSCLLNGVDIDSILLRAPLVVRGSTGPAGAQREAS